MRIKHDVDLRGLQAPMAVAAAVADSVYRAHHGGELTITSGTDGQHMVGSLHYSGLAIDCRLPMINVGEIVLQLRDALGPQFDVVLESTHIHIEHQPKTPPPAAITSNQ